MRWLGALVIALFMAILPLGMMISNDDVELRVMLPTPAPREIVASQASPLARPEVGPPSIFPRLEKKGELDLEGAGLALRSYRAVWGKRWEREVSWPVLRGPFDAEGTAWPCAIAIRFGPRFFDDGKPGGDDVEAVVSRVIRDQFPIDVFGMHFAAVAATNIHVKPVNGGVLIEGGITLADGGKTGDPTHFSVKATIALAERGGDLEAGIKDLSVGWSGKTRSAPLIALASLFIDVDEQARSVVAGRLKNVLSILKMPKEPLAPLPGRSNDRLLVRLCGAPVAKPEGLTVMIRVNAKLAEPRFDPSVPGPTHLDAPPKPDDVAWGKGEPAPVEAIASEAAIHQALYLLWQSGGLAAWGKRRDVVNGLEQKLAERLTLTVSEVDMRLPPVVVAMDKGAIDKGAAESAFRVRFGALGLGSMPDGRALMTYGEMRATAKIQSQDGTPKLAAEGTLVDLAASCVGGKSGAFELKPCLSDVVPVLREGGISSVGVPFDLPLADRLMRLNLVLGAELVLEGVEAETRGSPPVLHLRAQAKLVQKSQKRR